MSKKKCGYFKVEAGYPEPITAEVLRRVSFSEVDAMGVVWHGRYPVFFEEAYGKLSNICGLAYQEFLKCQIAAPIVQFHIDYHQPLFMDEEFKVRAKLYFSESARLNIEYLIIKKDNSIAESGYTVQIFVDVKTKNFCLASPQIWETCKTKWIKGEFAKWQKKL